MTDALGELRFTHETVLKAKGLAGVYLLATAGASVLLLGVCSGLAMMLGAVGSPDVDPLMGAVFLLIFGGAGLVFGGGSLGGAWWLWKRPREAGGTQRIEIRDHGVRLLKDETTREVTWDALSDFRSSPPHGRIYGVTVNTGYHFFALSVDGVEVSVSRTPQLKEMGFFIEEQVIRAQLPAAVDALKGGQTLTFGAVSLTPDGVTLKGLVTTTEPWEGFKGLYLGRMARIGLGTVRGPFYIETPNAGLLFSLVHVLTKG